MYWWEVLDKRLLHSHLRSGERILAGVSGGPDSTAMLVSLAEGAGEMGVKLFACYVDHGLRGQAALKEAAFVAEICSRLQVGFLSRRTLPLDRAPNLGSFEGKLRYLRYEAYASAAKEVGAAWVAVGHTADDLVETLLMHLVRGMALRGVVFHPVDTIAEPRIIRPLWQTTRARVHEFLQNRGITPLVDETNEDMRMLRNRVRHVLLPLLEDWNPGVREALLRTVRSWSEAAELVTEAAEMLLCEALNQGSLTASSLAVEPLVSYPRNVVRNEALAMWLEKRTGKRVLATHHDFTRLERLLDTTSGHVAVFPGGIVVARVGRELFACQLPNGEAASELMQRAKLVEALARAFVREKNDLVAAKLEEPHILRPTGMGPHRGVPCFRGNILDICGDEVTVELIVKSTAIPLSEPFYLRNRQAGDRVAGKRLKEIMGEHGIPFFLRDYLVLVTNASEQVLGVVAVPSLTTDILHRCQLAGAIELNHSRAKAKE